MSLRALAVRLPRPWPVQVDRVWLATGLILLLVFAAAPQQGQASLVFAAASLASVLPYLLASILIAAYAQASGADGLIAQAFRGHAAVMVLLAALVGALSPFCSCGVIPLIAALLAMGVPLSAVMAFWLASPIMDPSMFVLTAGVLGTGFALAKTAAAVGLGLLGGFGVMALQRFRPFGRRPQQPAEHRRGQDRADQLGGDERRRILRADAGEAVREGARDRHRGIGEGRRGSEPVGGGDVEPDRRRHRARAKAHAADDRRHEAEGRDDLAEPLPDAGARGRAEHQDRLAEHRMREPGAGEPAGDLGEDVSERIGGAELALQDEAEGHRRIEMRARDRPKDQDQDHQDRAGRQRVAEQRKREIAAGQALGHDPGAHHRGEQERRAERFRDQPARPVEDRRLSAQEAASVAALVSPMASSRRCRVSLSSERMGRLVKIWMRRSSWK